MTTTAAPQVQPLTRRRSGRGRQLLPYQVDWCNDLSRMKLWPKSRRIGADYAEAYDAIEKRLNKSAKGYRRSNYWYSSADESAAYETAEYWRFWLGVFHTTADHFTEEIEDPATGRTARAFCVQIPGGGPRLTAMTSNPRRFRSKGGDVCLSEIDFHDDPMGMHKAAYPTITWGDSYKVLSTHNGEGNFMDRSRKMAERHANGTASSGDIPWSVHLTTILDAVADGLVDRINEIKGTALSDEQFINDLRAGCSTEETWLEEYMAVPGRDASSWLTYQLIEQCEHDEAGTPQNYGDGQRYIGMDIGESKDRTVIWTVERVGDILWTREVLVMTDEDLSVKQAALLERMRHPKVVRACVDATGLGTQIAQEAERTGKGEGVKFTLPAKDELASPLRGYFEDRTVRIPGDGDTREQLHAVRMTRTANGTPRYDAARTEDGHADKFWALALACHAAKTPDTVPRMEVLL